MMTSSALKEEILRIDFHWEGQGGGGWETWITIFFVIFGEDIVHNYRENNLY